MGSKKIRYLFLSLLVIILGVVGFTQLHDQKITPDTADIKVMQSQTEENITSKDQEEPNSKKEETKNEKEDKEISEDSKKQDEDSEKEMRSKVEETVSTDLNQEKTNKKVAKSNLQNSQSKSKQTIKNENPKQSEQIDNKESTKKEPTKKEPKSSTKKKDTSKKTTEETEKPEKEESQKEDPKGQTVGVLITDGRTNNILPKVQIPYEKGNTALDVTIKALQKAGLQYSIRGTGAGAYVEGINNLYELDGGPLSGWHIRVDGNLIDRSSGVYPVEPGQTVHWNYTYNYLEDTENW